MYSSPTIGEKWIVCRKENGFDESEIYLRHAMVVEIYGMGECLVELPNGKKMDLPQNDEFMFMDKVEAIKKAATVVSEMRKTGHIARFHAKSH